MKYFGTNIALLRKRKGLSQAEMLDFTGIKSSTWSDYERSKTEPDFDALLKISEFFGIDIDSLLKEDLSSSVNLNAKNAEFEEQGKSKPIRKPFSKPKSENDDFLLSEVDSQYPFPVKEQIPPFIPPKVITIDTTGEENIVYVPVRARAGYLQGYGDPEFIEKLPQFKLPGLNNGTYRMFEVEGNSMFNTLGDRDRVIARYSTVSELRDERVYVLVTVNEGIIIKRILNRLNEGKIICKSDNNHRGEYPPIILDAMEIKEAWYVVEKQTRQLGPPGEIYKRVADLEGDLILIKDRLGLNQNSI